MSNNESRVFPFVRKADIFALFILIETLIIFLFVLYAGYVQRRQEPFITEKADLVRRLMLTDICLFTEARYTRHPSQADIHTPFQDHPMSLEHFPSGSYMLAPGHLVDKRDR